MDTSRAALIKRYNQRHAWSRALVREQITESRVQRLNAEIALDRLVEMLMEPIGQQARWQVTDAIRKADR